MVTKIGAALIAGAFFGAGAAIPANATVYDIVTGFSSSNPSGPWTDSYAGTAFTMYLPQGGSNPFGVPVWWTNLDIPDLTFIGQNTTGSTVHYLTVHDPNNTLWLDPGSYSNDAVTFTAPAAGNYYINGWFLGIDIIGNPHDVEVSVNGSPSYSGTISSFGELDNFSLSETLAAGQTVSFVVGTGATFYNLGTGLAARISTDMPVLVPPPVFGVPEPSTWATMLLGFAGLGVVGYRKAKSVQASPFVA